MRRRQSARVLSLATALAVVATGLFAAVASQPSAAGSGSAVTVSGHGRFQDLRVTLSQTTNLVDQVVDVTWTGGEPTYPTVGTFNLDYLQIMQCWGDDGDGPDRSQCEFGGNAAFDQRGGDWTTTRQLNYGDTLVDPDEKLHQDADSTDTVFVPFRSAAGKTVTGNANEFYDSSTTNEVPFARTRPDGSGEQPFEVLTSQEAPGLGCGALVSGTPRRCWLVVVPRDDQEVDGTTRAGGPNDQLRSSPLSASNWANRIVLPLSFAPTADVCPIGAAERPTVGVETVGEAMLRWQPVLCANNGPVYGYTQTLDGSATRQLGSDEPGLAFLNGKAAAGADGSDADAPLTVYAPIALSGLTIAYNIESQSPADAPDSIRRHDGRRITGIQLDQRLVAKLLTQSYRLGVDATAGYLKANPLDLTRDPEFLALNPQFKTLDFRGIGDMLVQAGVSGSTDLVWQWIASDDDAMNFLSGKPDPWGMKVNPFYQGMSVPMATFPKSDPFCHKYTTGPAPLCTLDAHPYTADFHDAARAASRGDLLARSAWDPFGHPPAYKKAAPQLSGLRAVIALTDTATAARYGLTPALLRNTFGQYVAPDEDGLLSGLDAMQADEDDASVLDANPGSDDPAAYPLTTMTYGVTVPSELTKADAADYASFIRFATTKGQQPGTAPGQLPDGYVPLPDQLRADAHRVAAQVAAREDGSSPSASASPDKTSGGGEGRHQSTGGGGGAALPPSTPAPSPSQSSSPTSSPVTSVLTNPVAAITPTDAMGWARLVVFLVLAAGLASALAGPALPALARVRAVYRRRSDRDSPG